MTTPKIEKEDDVKSNLPETQQLILNYFENRNNDNSNAEMVISSLPSLHRLNVFKTLKNLSDNGLLVKSDANPPTYSIADNLEINPKKDNATKKKPTDEEELKPSKGGRNTDKFIFRKQSYSKSRLVLEVLKSFVEEHPDYTLEQVQSTWKNDELQKRYGTIIEVAKAKKFCEGGRDRHFMKDVLTIGTKRTVVCNQWSSDLLIPFLELASSLKYKIVRE